MKKILLSVILTFSITFTFSQNNSKITGIWQAKLNGKFMTGKDLGATSAPYISHHVYYIFNKENCYFAICANKSSISKTNIQNLLDKQVAGEGDYEVFDSLDYIPYEYREKFENQAPFKPKTSFIEASIQNEPMSFYYEADTKKIYGLNKDVKFELVYLGPSW